MPNINFVHNQPTAPHKRKLRVWGVISAIFLGALIVSIFPINFLQILTARNAYHERLKAAEKMAEYDATMNRHQTLKKEQDELKNRMAKLERRETQQKNPIEMVVSIEKIISPAGLQGIRFLKKEVEITAVAPSSDEAHRMLDALEQEPLFNSAEITGLHNAASGKGVQFTIRAKT